MARKSTKAATRKSAKTTATTTATTTTREQRNDQMTALRASINDAAAALAEELKAGMSDRLRTMLEFGARFHQYSASNQVLILTQCPDATRVAGYKTWENMGYHVAKGQQGIRILAPRPYTHEETKEDGEVEVKSGTYFVAVPGFDVSQLNAEEVAAKPLPSFFSDDAGTDEQTEQLLARAETAIKASGIRLINSTKLEGSVQGTSSGGTITMRATLVGVRRFGTLIHEWAHELLHRDPATRAETARAQRECHAEATAYVVMAHFGIRNELSSDYLHSWSQTAETLMGELAMVQRAASHIIEALSHDAKTPAAPAAVAVAA
jgi:antirestriction protein ArdC